MKAISSFLSAACAAALWVSIAATGIAAINLTVVTAAEAAVVSRIEVRGNQRVDEETIRNYVNVEPGKSFSNADLNDGVKRLFSTGLFADVDINKVGSTLVIEVEEHAIVNQVIFQGNKKIKDAALSAAVDLSPRDTFSQDTLESDTDRVREAYARVGRSDAEVSSRTIELGGNRVNVVFEINEGGRTKIEGINFVGNNAFGNRRLRDVIATKRSNFLSFLFRNDVYDEDRLRADEETLRRFYFNRGYADFRVISSTAELDETNNEYVITFTLDEGERYTFSEVGVESSVPGIDVNSLDNRIKTRSGKSYSAKNVEDTIIGLTEAVTEQGYAFAQVVPRGDRNFETRTISVVYTIDQGPRTYIERIEIRGNSRTRDFVIRREFDVSEGDAFNQVMIQRAKKRLERLDFFERVSISSAPGSGADQVIVIVDVEEKATGEFSIGAGYSTGGEDQGPQLEGSIAERNFLGRGQFIRFSAGAGEDSRSYQLSFTEPYFLGRRIAAGFDVFHQTNRFTNYESETTGGTIRFGLPITEYLSTTVAYHLSQEKYNLRSGCDANGDGIPNATCAVAASIVSAVASSPWTKSSVSNTLLYNTIDDMNNPHDGIYATFTTEFAGLGGNAKFVKVTARGSYYRTLSEERDIVGILVAGGGHVEGFGTGGLRVFDLFRSTAKIIRGFNYDGIGPRDGVTGEQIGGESYIHASVEAQFPLPAVPESFGLKGAVFADAASLFGTPVAGAVGTGFSLRGSVGASLIWASPFGPLRVDYSVPVATQTGDREQAFQFGISQRF